MMVTVKEGEDVAIRLQGGRTLVIRGFQVSSISFSGDKVEFMTLRATALIRRSCMKCGFVWERHSSSSGSVREPRICPDRRCGVAELGRIEVKE